MRYKIHRGTQEIGGSCVEIWTDQTRIVVDIGMPLVEKDRSPFNFNNYKKQSSTELIKNGIIPDIKGLYQDSNQRIDGILISHAHQDHYGLLVYINSEIPIYLSAGTKELIDISNYFGQTNAEVINFNIEKPWQSFAIKDFKITPYLVDHSGFDALAFLIEANDKRIFYSGDFRGHGRKEKVFQSILKNPPKDIDHLLLEGTMIGRGKGKYEGEVDIEIELTRLFKEEPDLFFVACSSQNIDRIVSIYKACKKSNRIFVIDPYTAYILNRLKKISPNIPQFNWGKNIRVFFVPNSYTNKMGDDKSLFKFKSAKITYEEMQDNRRKLVIKDSYLTRKIFANKKDLENSKCIFSMWDGYLRDVKDFWDNNNVPIIKVHSSGHAYVEELQEFVEALKPKTIVPIHTFDGEDYKNLFSSHVLELKDKELATV